jgi:hypothetical protein
MQQPEAKFKRKLIELHAEAAGAGAWYSYLAAGGAGQKQGIPDLIFGDPAHGLLWVEAKRAPTRKAPQMRTLQVKTIRSLQAVGARVPILCLEEDTGLVTLYVIAADTTLDIVRFGSLGPVGATLWPNIWASYPK